MRYVVVRRQRVNQQDDSDVSNYTRSKVGGGQKNLRKEMTRNSANLNFVKCPSTTVVNYKMQTFLCWGIPLREIVFMLRNASKRERFYVEKSLQERAFLCWGMPPRESVFMLRNASKRERFYVEECLQERVFLCWGMPLRESVLFLPRMSKLITYHAQYTGSGLNPIHRFHGLACSKTESHNSGYVVLQKMD